MVTKNELNIIISARDLQMRKVFERATKRMERLESDARRTSSRTNKHFSSMGKASKKAGEQISAAFPGVGLFSASTAGAVAFGAAITSIVRNGDKLNRLKGRLEAITGSADKAVSGVEGLSAIMVETGADIDTASQSFTRFTQAGKAIGATQKEVLTLTDTLLKLGRIGGGSVQELQSGAIQLGQALASGQLRGDELRSVMENLPLVTEALADSLGVSIGKLREMAEAGELTSRRVFDALLSKADETNEKFAKLPITVDMAAGKMSAAWSRFAAQIDDSIGLSRTLASVLDGIAAKFDRASLTGLDLVQAQISEAKERLSAAEFSTGTGLSARDGGVGGKYVEQGIREEIAALKAVEAQYLKSAAAVRRFEKSKVVPVSDTGGGSARSSSGGGPQQAPLSGRLDGVYEQSIDLLIQREELIGKTAAAQARLNAENTLRNRLESEAGDQLENSGVRQNIEELVVVYGYLAQATYEAEAAERARQQAADDAQRAAKEALDESVRTTDAFVDGLFSAQSQAKNFEDALKQIGVQLVKLAASDFLKGLFGGSGGGGIFGTLFSGAGSSLLGSFRGSSGASVGGGFSSGVALPAFAGGTNFAPGGASIVGERGPEVVNLPRGAQVVPNHQLGNAFGGSQAQYVHVTVDAGPEFEVSVQQAAGSQTASMIGQNNKMRDKSFQRRFKSADNEIRLDNR